MVVKHRASLRLLHFGTGQCGRCNKNKLEKKNYPLEPAQYENPACITQEASSCGQKFHTTTHLFIGTIRQVT